MEFFRLFYKNFLYFFFLFQIEKFNYSQVHKIPVYTTHITVLVHICRIDTRLGSEIQVFWASYNQISLKKHQQTDI